MDVTELDKFRGNVCYYSPAYRRSKIRRVREGMDMLNDAAKKMVRRAARAAREDMRDRIRLGAREDDLCAEAWETAQTYYPEFRQWSSAREYFENVFYGMDRASQ